MWCAALATAFRPEEQARCRLTPDVVTGKLDVREAAQALPDELPVAQLPDDSEVQSDLEIEPEAEPVIGAEAAEQA